MKRIKAKYYGAYGAIAYKYFNSHKEMLDFFRKFKMCKFISYKVVE